MRISVEEQEALLAAIYTQIEAVKRKPRTNVMEASRTLVILRRLEKKLKRRMV